MEIVKKGKKKVDKPYQQLQTVTESSQLNHVAISEPISNLNFKPKRVDTLKIETLSIEESTLPILSGPVSHLVTSRRSRRKFIPRLTSSKNILSNSKTKKQQQSQNIHRFLRITDLIHLFFEKAGRNSPFRQPVSYDPYQKEENFIKHDFIRKIENIQIPKMAENICIAAEVLYIILYIFAYPLILLFDVVDQSGFCLSLQVFGLLFCCLDILKLCRSIPEKQKHCLSLQNFEKCISQIKNGVIAKLIIITLTILSIILSHLDIEQGSYLFIVMIMNIKIYLGQISQLQNHFFQVTHHQKYWDLVKVIVMNLIVCHLLACTLIGIAQIKPEQSWMMTNDIREAPWWQQYIWSYYFGTTIILTIGFGDLHPCNYIEAFFIIIISFCACMFFGYNINYIGNLINLINQQQVEKNSKLKIFNALAKRSAVSNSTSKQITNYIVQSSKIRQQFNYAQEKELIQQLPDGLRSSFLAEANLKLFNHLRTMIKFSNKTIERLSLKIEAKICHPDQIIKRAYQTFNLMILQSGEVGLMANRKDSRLHGRIVQRISNTIDQQSKLICADLLQNEGINYDIKSLAYSTIYTMDKLTFEDCIRQSKEDYQVYREALDACKFKLNQYGITKCKYCQKQHTLFECPRLHFCPFKKTLPLHKNNSHKAEDKQKRVKYQRIKPEINYYDYPSTVSIEQTPDKAGSFQQIIHNSKNVAKQGVSKQKRGSFNPPKTRQSINLAMTMVNQLREDIKKLKVEVSEANFEFTLWDTTDSDEVCDFKYYFPKHNSSELNHKYSLLHSRNYKKKWMKRFP